MGCWNKTCGLSNLHITSGTPVYVFVLEYKGFPDSLCYSTPFYGPLLLPFNSVYNDYGGGEDSSGPGFAPIMAAIKEQLVEMDLGKNTSHDIAIKKEAFDEELFFEAIHEDRLSVQARYRPEADRLNFVMFRKDIVDNIIANWRREIYVGSGQGTTGYDNSYVNIGFQDIINDIPEFLDRLEEVLSEEQADGMPAKFSFKLMDGLKNLFSYKEGNRVGDWIRGDSYNYARFLKADDLIIEHMEKGERKEAQDLLVEYLKGKYIDAFMSMTRRVWIPGAHEGSQNQEADGYRVMNRAIDAVLDAEDARWNDEYADEAEVEA